MASHIKLEDSESAEYESMYMRDCELNLPIDSGEALGLGLIDCTVSSAYSSLAPLSPTIGHYWTTAATLQQSQSLKVDTGHGWGGIHPFSDGLPAVSPWTDASAFPSSADPNTPFMSAHSISRGHSSHTSISSTYENPAYSTANYAAALTAQMGASPQVLTTMEHGISADLSPYSEFFVSDSFNTSSVHPVSSGASPMSTTVPCPPAAILGSNVPNGQQGPGVTQRSSGVSEGELIVISPREMRARKRPIRATRENFQAECLECGQFFKKNSHLKNHNTRKHNHGPTKDYECNECQRSFKRETDLNRHFKAVSSLSIHGPLQT